MSSTTDPRTPRLQTYALLRTARAASLVTGDEVDEWDGSVPVGEVCSILEERLEDAGLACFLDNKPLHVAGAFAAPRLAPLWVVA